jgi:beta-glucosidase-like glycosyl hydrolase
MATMRRIFVMAGFTLLMLGGTMFAQQYKNPNLPVEERAADLCSRLTLEEKVALMQNASPAIPRLDIPQFEWWSEALHGVGLNGKATVFPATIGMAASFNDTLLYKVYCAASDEARAKNNEARRSGEIKRFQGLSFWTPNVNIFRDPRWGRGQETYGEDPYLTTRMGLAVVRGLQGYTIDGVRKDRCLKLLACAKHFAVHSGPEWNRHSFNLENISSRDLWETYLPAFKSLVQEGGVREVMCAYQRIDGEPCCGNTRYLQQILRDEWGFKGLVVSDCSAISDFHVKGRHGVAGSEHEASAMAVRAGTDVECGRNYRSLPGADVASIVGQASDVDVVIFVGGISSKQEGEEMKVKLPGFRGGDRTDIELPEAQRRVIAALHEADAIVQAWYAGEQGGLAIAETLFGSNNPSGKLPLTFYKNLSQLPDYEDYNMNNRTYRYFRGEPLYPFGYGLSYTTFQYKKGKAGLQKDGSVRLSFQLKNTGKRAGTEIAQVYIRRTEDVNGPIKTLRDFRRITLQPGETQTVSFVLQPVQFDTFDESTHTMRVMPGEYEIMYGGSSAGHSLKKINIKLLEN